MDDPDLHHVTRARWHRENALSLYAQGDIVSHRKAVKSMKRACYFLRLANMWEEAALCSDTWKTWKAPQ